MTLKHLDSRARTSTNQIGREKLNARFITPFLPPGKIHFLHHGTSYNWGRILKMRRYGEESSHQVGVPKEMNFRDLNELMEEGSIFEKK